MYIVIAVFLKITLQTQVIFQTIAAFLLAAWQRFTLAAQSLWFPK